MKVWMVFVRVRWANSTVVRYLDSQWARQQAAIDRRHELTDCFKVFGCWSQSVQENGAAAEITQGSIADASVPDADTEKEKAE